MYAVMKTGGKQYRVAPGDALKIEKIEADVGARVDFDNVLMVAQDEDIRIGTPHVDGGKVVATVLEQGRGKKVQIIKFKRRKHHLKRMGHRQAFTEVRITSILADGIEETWQPPPVWQPPVETEEVQEAPNVEAIPSDIATAEEPNVEATAEKPNVEATSSDTVAAEEPKVEAPTNEVTPPDSQKKE